jgi:hypothetical protein
LSAQAAEHGFYLRRRRQGFALSRRERDMKTRKHPKSKKRSIFKRRNRNYQLEYIRRIALAESRDQSRSVGRGHARAGEKPKSPGLRLVNPTLPDERAIKLISKGSSLRSAAKAVGLTEERVRRYLKENTTAARQGRVWIIQDDRPRQFPFYSEGRLVSPWLAPKDASKAGKYDGAVDMFLETGEAALIEPFIGESVVDIHGKRHPFETDLNTLYELDAAGELNFPEIYKIVSEGL